MSDTQVKIELSWDTDYWHGYYSELLWAQPAGGHYTIMSIPFFARDISYKDTVSASPSESLLRFERVVARGGHSTYRLLRMGSDPVPEDLFRARLQEILNLGCTYESGKPGNVTLYAIDIPPEVDADAVFALCERGAQDEVWDFEVAHDGHPEQQP
jgi:hypothetical protein